MAADADLESDPKFQRLARTIAPVFIRDLINAGIIHPEGKTGYEIAQDVRDFFDRHRNLEIDITIDHTEDLLKQARAFKKTNNPEISALFYALYMEHKLNSYMAHLATRKKLSGKDIESLIRDSSYRSKCTWLFHVFGIPAFTNAHVNRLTKLMELRNAFVHYKWKPDNDQRKKELEAMLNSIEGTVRYLRYFETKYLTLTSRRRVHKLLEKRA